MHPHPLLLTLLIAAVCAGGCASLPRQPEIAKAGIEPAVLNPGDSAIIKVEVDDRFDIVDRVRGIVREDPSITFNLTDDGVPPDEEAGDDVWMLQVDVPFQAPPGDFTMEITAIDADGNPILVQNDAGEATPLSTTFNVVIEYAEQAQP